MTRRRLSLPRRLRTRPRVHGEGRPDGVAAFEVRGPTSAWPRPGLTRTEFACRRLVGPRIRLILSVGGARTWEVIGAPGRSRRTGTQPHCSPVRAERGAIGTMTARPDTLGRVASTSVEGACPALASVYLSEGRSHGCLT